MDLDRSSVPRPRLGIVAGPNGSGKSSFYERHLRPQFPRWVNADEIARTLSDLAGNKRDLAAARVAEEDRERLLYGARDLRV